MDERQLARSTIGAQAVGQLSGMLKTGVLNAHPRTAALAKELVDAWEAIAPAMPVRGDVA